MSVDVSVFLSVSSFVSEPETPTQGRVDREAAREALAAGALPDLAAIFRASGEFDSQDSVYARASRKALSLSRSSATLYLSNIDRVRWPVIEPACRGAP